MPRKGGKIQITITETGNRDCFAPVALRSDGGGTGVFMNLSGCCPENENLIKQPPFTIENGKNNRLFAINNLKKTQKQPLTNTLCNYQYNREHMLTHDLWGVNRVLGLFVGLFFGGGGEDMTFPHQ